MFVLKFCGFPRSESALNVVELTSWHPKESRILITLRELHEIWGIDLGIYPRVIDSQSVFVQRHWLFVKLLTGVFSFADRAFERCVLLHKNLLLKLLHGIALQVLALRPLFVNLVSLLDLRL